jgi:hypothetical protein
MFLSGLYKTRSYYIFIPSSEGLTLVQIHSTYATKSGRDLAFLKVVYSEKNINIPWNSGLRWNYVTTGLVVGYTSADNDLE